MGGQEIMNGITKAPIMSCAIVIFAYTNLWAEIPRQLLHPPSTYPHLTMHHPDVSPDGKYIALSAGADYLRSTIWIFNRETGTGHQVTQPTSDMMWGDVCARWSPDGQRVLFVSDRGGATGVYVYDIKSQSMEKIRDSQVPSGAWWAQAVWDPTGTKILYPDSDSSGEENLYLIDLATREIAQITEHKGASVAFPSWSPSGRFIVYSTSDENARSRLMRLDQERGVTEVIHAKGGMYAFPRWNADERWLAYHDAHRVFLLNTDKAAPIEVAAPPGYETWGPAWDGNSDVLVFQKRQLNSGPVVVYDLENESSWELFEMSQLFSRGGRGTYWATWSRDSDKVSFFAGSRSSRTDTSLVIATVSTKTIKEIPGPDRARHHLRAPVWSKSRAGYIYPATTESGEGVIFESWPDRKTELLFTREQVIPLLSMTADEEIIAYVAHEKGDSNNQNIWFFDRISETHYQVTFRNSIIDMLSFSPDGEKLIFRSGNNTLVLDTNTNTVHEVGKSYFWSGAGHTWQGNDQLIFEGAKTGPPAALYEYHIAERTTTLFHGNKARHCFNPIIKPVSNQNVYYQYAMADTSDLNRINIATGRSELVLENVRNAVFSEDGSKFIYLDMKGRTNASIWAMDVSKLLDRSLP